MRQVAIIGTGMCDFGFYPHRSMPEMGEDALWNVLNDSGVKPQDIQAAYGGWVGYDTSMGVSMAIQICLEQVGITGIPVNRLENMCASSACAFRDAYIAVASGMYDIVLAMGIEKMSPTMVGDIKLGVKGTTRVLLGNDQEGAMGLFPPVMFGLIVRKYMEEYGLTREQLSKVAVKNRFNASLNPHACFQKPITIEEVSSSRLIADPLRLLDCCPECDGCSAVILASKEAAKKYTTRPVYVAGTSQTSSYYRTEEDMPYEGDTEARAAKGAYEMAGIGPEDLDVAAIHDCFTIAEIIFSERVLFLKEGEYIEWIENGYSELGGKLPINTDGGLLSKGHPLGATGVSQIIEIVNQLKGNAGKRQVKGAKVGLTCNFGGIYKGFLGNTVAHVLKV